MWWAPMRHGPQSVALTQELQNARADNASDYRIRLIGKKVYIVAANNEALQAAVEYFLEKFRLGRRCSHPGGLRLLLPAGT